MSDVTVFSIDATRPSKAWTVALWVAQIVLAGMFIMAGVMKATTPIAELVVGVPWAAQIPELVTRFIGVSELLAGIGLVLPAATRIRPGLTILSAIGLALVMLLAALFHLAQAEYQPIAINVALGAVAGFIAWGRARKAPILARNQH